MFEYYFVNVKITFTTFYHCEFLVGHFKIWFRMCPEFSDICLKENHRKNLNQEIHLTGDPIRAAG